MLLKKETRMMGLVALARLAGKTGARPLNFRYASLCSPMECPR
jgi:hypothetical protein